MAHHIFRVGEITRALKDVVEGQFPFVWVRGQVSNLSRPASGHVYFSLRDEDAVLGVVWFKGSQEGLSLNDTERYDPLTGEVLPPECASAWLCDGADVLCAGRLTVYAPRGSYQLVAELVQDMGLGRLHREFEALKARLSGLGWFDSSRKRPLPPDPKRVAVVTAPTGAAIRDFLRIAESRGTGCEVKVYPALVQGEAAPGRIAAALDAAGADGWAQAAVLIRGGGSLEDLWAFNTEEVCAAVVRSPVPVLCGVGHEVDVTLADLAADVRAATPSHAAQLLWPERSVLAQRADEAETALSRAYSRFLSVRNESLAGLARALSWLSPRGRVERLAERLDALNGRALLAGRAMAGAAQTRLDVLRERLERASERGPRSAQARLDALAARLDGAGRGILAARMARLDVLRARLAGLDPGLPLARGYALARKADGTFLRRAQEAVPGDKLDILVRDGIVGTFVAVVEKNDHEPPDPSGVPPFVFHGHGPGGDPR